MLYSAKVRVTGIVFVVFVLACASRIVEAGYPNASPPPPRWKTGFDSITEQESEELLSILVGDGFDGRGTGQEGYVRAAHFVAGKLAEYGFEPIGDNGTYFQNLPYTQVSHDTEASSISIGDGAKIQGADELGFNRLSSTRKVSGKMVLIAGDVSDVKRLPDASIVENRVVVIATQDYSWRLESILNRSGAVALITVTNGKPESRSQLRFDTRKNYGGLLKATISRPALERIVAQLELDSVPDQNTPLSVTPYDLELTVDVKVVNQRLFVPNVVGWFPGTDPEVRHEHIIIGAHLDHLGNRNGGLYPGADDNGSGSTALIQIANAIKANPEKPRRSILYIAFAAEEVGLIGSKYYANNPIKPLSDAICMLNIDMIGRNEEKGDEPASENEYSIHLVASQRLSKELHELTLEANQYVGFEFEFDEEKTVFHRSDQKSFHDKGIPVTFLFGGFNPYYHQTTDTLNGINFSKIANAARLNYIVAMLAAEKGELAKNK